MTKPMDMRSAYVLYQSHLQSYNLKTFDSAQCQL